MYFHYNLFTFQGYLFGLIPYPYLATPDLKLFSKTLVNV